MSAARYETAARFPTTRWSLVDLIRRGHAEATREALEELLTRYLPALQAHLTLGRRVAADEADDLVQDFVARKILEKDLIARADRDLGKFRTFLLTALDRFLIDRIRSAGARKRSAKMLAIDDQEEYLRSDQTPSDIFDATWARGVLAEALRRMYHHCQTSDRMDLWRVFESRLVRPILEGTPPVDYRQLVESSGLKSPAHASNLLITAKRTFARTLRSVVAEYCRDEREMESEIQELREVLARCGE